MSTHLPLHYWSVAQLRQAYSSGAVSPAEATQACLDRILQLATRFAGERDPGRAREWSTPALAPSGEPSRTRSVWRSMTVSLFTTQKLREIEIQASASWKPGYWLKAE